MPKEVHQKKKTKKKTDLCNTEFMEGDYTHIITNRNKFYDLSLTD